MASTRQEQKFHEHMKDMVEVPGNILDVAIEWIKEHLEPYEVFEEKQLEAWAEANGFEKK